MSEITDPQTWIRRAEEDYLIAANHLNTLSEHAVRTRYPGEDPTFQEAEEAIKVAKAVRDFARKILGV